MTQKRILVTGATGFVGSHLTRHLLAGGHEVFVTVRPSSDPWRIEPLIDDLTIIPYSLNDPDLNTFIRDIQPEICIHLAWFTEPGKYAASIKNIYSLQASLNLIEQLECNDCQKFIGIGSCFEYDFSLGYFSENSLVKPSSFYSATKIAFSQVVEQWSQYHQMQTLWLRLFYQYGADRR